MATRRDLKAQHRIEAFRRKMKDTGKRFDEGIQKGLTYLGVTFRSKMVEERLSSPETDQPYLAVRSGQLRRAFQDNMKVTAMSDGTITLEIWVDVPYAHVHEFGTVGAGGTLPDIVPVRASWLTIPLAAAKQPSGVSLGSAREVGAEYDSTFVDWEAPSGSPILYGVRGDSVVPLFVFVKKVAIKPRLGFFSTWKGMAPLRREIFSKVVANALKGKSQGAS